MESQLRRNFSPLSPSLLHTTSSLHAHNLPHHLRVHTSIMRCISLRVFRATTKAHFHTSRSLFDTVQTQSGSEVSITSRITNLEESMTLLKPMHVEMAKLTEAVKNLQKNTDSHHIDFSNRLKQANNRQVHIMLGVAGLVSGYNFFFMVLGFFSMTY
jgi:hypothetical protein